MDKKIYFTLDTRVPETLSAQYNGRTEKVFVGMFPLDDVEHLAFYEDIIKAAENFLKNVLNFPN